MKRIVLVFGVLIICLLLLFKLSTYYWVTGDLNAEFIIAGLALLFFGIGLWVSKHNKTKAAAEFVRDQQKLIELGISKRELEVLEAMAKGHSNKEIGSLLFVSESTVKTHVSNVLVKLDAKRRTQAIYIAQALNLVAK